MRLQKLFLSVLVVSFLCTGNVYAEEDSSSFLKGKGKWRNEKQEKFYSQLNLTEEQKKQLADNKSKYRKKMKAQFEQKKFYRGAIKNELMKSELEMDKINNVQNQLKSLQAQMTDDRLSSILEVRKILTSEQFSKFISLMEEEKKEFKSRHK